jgi:hypothetical protein
MTFSYSVDQLNTNPVYFIRDQIGDADSTDPLLQDEEIAAAVGSNSSIYSAAADCCRKIANRFARKVDQAAGGMKLAFSQAFKAYSASAIRFDVMATQIGSGAGGAAGTAGASLFGGISISDKLNNELDQNRVPTVFRIGMHDNMIPVPPAGQEETGEGDGPD